MNIKKTLKNTAKTGLAALLLATSACKAPAPKPAEVDPGRSQYVETELATYMTQPNRDVTVVFGKNQGDLRPDRVLYENDFETCTIDLAQAPDSIRYWADNAHVSLWISPDLNRLSLEYCMEALR